MTNATVLQSVNEMASPVFQSDQMVVTPTIAERWLSYMPRNRSLSAREVEKFARDMARGDWQITGESIQFDTNGNIIDGQHRLRAVILAGVPVTLLVVRGLRSTAQDVVDSGRKRTAADVVGMNGYGYSALTAAAAKLCIHYMARDFVTANQVAMRALTTSEILTFIVNNSDFVANVDTIGPDIGLLPTRPSVSAFTFHILACIDRSAALGFFDDLRNMRTNGSGDPRFTLIRRMATARQDREKLSSITEAHYMFRAWNAHRVGQQLTVLRAGAGIDFQVPR